MARKRSPTFKQVQRDLADVMDMVRHYILEPHQRGEKIDAGELARLSTAYVQVVQTYVKVAGFAELQPQIEEIQEELREIRQGSLRA